MSGAYTARRRNFDATTPCYFAAHISMIEEMLRTPLSLVPDGMFSILFLPFMVYIMSYHSHRTSGQFLAS